MWILIVFALSAPPADLGPFFGPYPTADECEQDKHALATLRPDAKLACVELTTTTR